MSGKSCKNCEWNCFLCWTSKHCMRCQGFSEWVMKEHCTHSPDAMVIMGSELGKFDKAVQE